MIMHLPEILLPAGPDGLSSLGHRHTSPGSAIWHQTKPAWLPRHVLLLLQAAARSCAQRV